MSRKGFKFFNSIVFVGHLQPEFEGQFGDAELESKQRHTSWRHWWWQRHGTGGG